MNFTYLCARGARGTHSIHHTEFKDCPAIMPACP
jgi:hypothetical protein